MACFLPVTNLIVNETSGYADFVVRLSAPATSTITVSYGTSNGTAEYYSSSSDYSSTYGTLRFAPGVTTQTVRVPITNNVLAENTESFFLELTNAKDASGTAVPIANKIATATIIDDDSGFEILNYGLGDDVYSISNLNQYVWETPDGGIDWVVSSINYSLVDTDGAGSFGAYVENLMLTGTAIVATGNTLANILVGNDSNNQLYGMEGNDLLLGGAGNDTLDGGSGIDTALFNGNFADYQISYNRALGTATVTDKRTPQEGQSAIDGTDSLKSIEVLQFADKSFYLTAPKSTQPAKFGASESFLFDPVYYLLKNPELSSTVTLSTALDHYQTVGAAAGAAPNAWFDPVYYANRWADLKPLNLDAVTLFAHYNKFGVWEGRSAGPAFDKYDGARYLEDNPDVAAYVDAYVNDFLGSRSNGAIAHYIIYGSAEGRVAYDTSGAPIAQAVLIGAEPIDYSQLP